jgi:hypothetical protein
MPLLYVLYALLVSALVAAFSYLTRGSEDDDDDNGNNNAPPVPHPPPLPAPPGPVLLSYRAPNTSLQQRVDAMQGPPIEWCKDRHAETAYHHRNYTLHEEYVYYKGGKLLGCMVARRSMSRNDDGCHFVIVWETGHVEWLLKEHYDDFRKNYRGMGPAFTAHPSHTRVKIMADCWRAEHLLIKVGLRTEQDFSAGTVPFLAQPILPGDR